jgi:thiamine pyrophosphate-dependent acetolactate synthase large subunit-like protein
MESTLVFLDVREPADFVQLNSNWPTIGLGMGTAIGAAVARPSRTTILSTGDAGLMMALGDLETAIRHCLPILIVVSNDQAWGSEAVFLRSQGLPVDVAQIATPSFAAVAASMGATGRTVTDIEDLRALEGELDRVGRGPLVLDCRINAGWVG